MPFGLSVQVSRFELDLIPAQVHEFGSPQAVPIGHEDHRAVAVTPAVSRSGFHQPLDLGLSKVFTGAQVAIGQPLSQLLGLQFGETILRCRLAKEMRFVGKQTECQPLGTIDLPSLLLAVATATVTKRVHCRSISS
jgi:hypothetical protein